MLAHTEQDLDTMLARLASYASPAELAVAIERADGHRLRRLEPVDAVTCELQALVRLRDDHVGAKTAASMKLGALLDAHWPGAKQLFFRLAAKITLAFLAEFPTPQAAAQLDQAELAAFCRRHADRGGRPPAELWERLRSAPRPPVRLDPTVLAQLIGAQLIGAQVQLLATLLATMPTSTRPSATGWAPIPRSTCWPDCPASASSATPNSSPNWAQSWTVPTAPSTPPPKPAPPRDRASGKTSSVQFRLAANHRARQPCTASPTTPATAPQGSQAVCRRPRPRQAPPPSGPGPRPGLAPGHLGLLAHQHRLRPGHRAEQRLAA
jgi:hypothetical protein